jgi:hypothetical protein
MPAHRKATVCPHTMTIITPFNQGPRYCQLPPGHEGVHRVTIEWTAPHRRSDLAD